MTGIERFRELADKYAELGKYHTTIDVVPSGMAMLFSSIANQIEREHAEDCYGMVIDHGTVSRVASEMERHVSGVEGMEDSPVARWARELREALGGNGRDPAADVSVSAYDLLPQEDREAIAWVREHGGIDHVRAEWRSRRNLKRMYEKVAALAEQAAAKDIVRNFIDATGGYTRSWTKRLSEQAVEAIVSEMASAGYDEIAEEVAARLTRSQKFREKVAAALAERGA